MGNGMPVTGSVLVRAMPLRPVVDRLRTGALDPAKCLADALDRIDAVDPQLRAFLPEPDRRARLMAELAALRSDRSRADRPLYGVPVAVKDLYRVDGLPTRAGSRLAASHFAGPQSHVISVLRRAGCLVLGKTCMDEFGCSEPPSTRNPHDLTRTPGGSSSGSAAAVASGMAPLAVGSQTQRSLIGPAAFCGVVGFKPSYGRVSFDGVPLAPSADTVGLLAQDVAGVELAARTLIDDWMAAAGPRRPLLGVAGGTAFLGCLPSETRESFDRQVATLRRGDFAVRDVPVPWDAETGCWTAVLNDLLLAELANVHRRLFDSHAARYRPRTAAAIRVGLAIPPSRRDECRALLPHLRRSIEQAMVDAGIDVWICPSSLGPAPVGLELTGYVETTLIWSWAGLPCISVPAGQSAGGLPLGLQIVGRFGADESVLAWAADLAECLQPTALVADPTDTEEE
jgi:Asp-tRNA(Asn)/Glu-tRNA(Gln) amidotransferase A subunit family amidase